MDSVDEVQTRSGLGMTVTFPQRARRDGTRVIYEILLQVARGVSKTRIIFNVNLNHRMAERYTGLLMKRDFLRLESQDRGVSFRLTDKGRRLLGLLTEVEGELEDMFAIAP